MRFTLEPCEVLRIRRERFGQDLQGDLAVQLRIGGLVNLSHAPLSDEGGHVVMAESGADLESLSSLRLIGAILRPAHEPLHHLHGIASPWRTCASCEDLAVLMAVLMVLEWVGEEVGSYVAYVRLWQNDSVATVQRVALGAAGRHGPVDPVVEWNSSRYQRRLPVAPTPVSA